jgi:hypothetical protein
VCHSAAMRAAEGPDAIDAAEAYDVAAPWREQSCCASFSATTRTASELSDMLSLAAWMARPPWESSANGARVDRGSPSQPAAPVRRLPSAVRVLDRPRIRSRNRASAAVGSSSSQGKAGRLKGGGDMLPAGGRLDDEI